jgi:hypothetical protein
MKPFYLLLKVFGEFRTLGTRTDQAHISPHDVPQLREFIETCLSKKGADAGNTDVMKLRHDSPGLTLRVLAHRSKFTQHEFPSTLR